MSGWVKLYAVRGQAAKDDDTGNNWQIPVGRLKMEIWRMSPVWLLAGTKRKQNKAWSKANIVQKIS